MKIKKLISLLIIVSILITAGISLTGCSRGEVVLSLGNINVHADMYNFWLADMKNTFIVQFTDVQDTPEFWASAVGREVARQIEEDTQRIVTEMLVLNYLFNYYNLRLPVQAVAQVDGFIEDLIMSVHFGASRSELNRALLDNYGITINRLRQILIFKEQATIASAHISQRFSPENLSSSEINDFFTSQFHHFDFIFIDLEHKTLLDEDGDPVRDTVRDGYAMIPLLPEEREERELLAADIIARLEAGEDFDELSALYNDFRFDNPMPYGVYFSNLNIFRVAPFFGNQGHQLLANIVAADVGEIVTIGDEQRHIIAKVLPLENNAFAEQRYASFFSSFDELIKQYNLELIIADHGEELQENQEFLRLVCAVFSPRGLGLLG